MDDEIQIIQLVLADLIPEYKGMLTCFCDELISRCLIHYFGHLAARLPGCGASKMYISMLINSEWVQAYISEVLARVVARASSRMFAGTSFSRHEE